MNPISISHGGTYLAAAFLVTWGIHVAYLLVLTATAKRLRDEAEELKKR